METPSFVRRASLEANAHFRDTHAMHCKPGERKVD